MFNSIITLSVTLLYFGVLQYFLKGQSVGKKMFNIQIVSANDKKINILNYLLRSLIINNVLLNGINLLILQFASQEAYIKGNNVISIILSIVEAVTIFLVISREDHRGLHDLICNTKVISTKKEEPTIETKEATIVEEKPVEAKKEQPKKETPKKKTTSKTTNKKTTEKKSVKKETKKDS